MRTRRITPENFKVPKHIRHAIHRIAELNAQAQKYMGDVEAWLDYYGFNSSTDYVDDYKFPTPLRDGSGIGLEEFEYGVDVTDEFCKKLEEMYHGELGD